MTGTSVDDTQDSIHVFTERAARIVDRRNAQQSMDCRAFRRSTNRAARSTDRADRRIAPNIFSTHPLHNRFTSISCLRQNLGRVWFCSPIIMKTGLQLNAQLENIKKFSPVGDDFRWYLKLTCSNCGEVTNEFVYCSLDENCPKKGGRGQASLDVKCKLCKRENSIDIVRESLCSYNEEDSGKFKTIVVFDCRGVSPTDFDPRVGWDAEGLETGTLFSNIDLQEKEWFDYDEKASQSVSITELQHQFVSVKH